MQRHSLKLLGTSHCHLCEEAEAILKQALSHGDFQNNILLQKIDVIDHDNLYALYALKIPVLLFTKENATLELHWPFAEDEMKDFLTKALSQGKI